ncbi:MAG: hypothetical protein NT011_13145 [Kiritimatiellaeota bacterium]|nr:hypothetical protein [Kiritimatiellota bacterium]
MKKRRREEDMYPAIKRYFIKKLDCEHISVDLPGQKKVHLPRNLSKRDPDVLGITTDGEVVAAEGKLLSQSGQPFEVCIEQLLSLKSFADHLYAFFPKEEWNELSADDVKTNRKRLKNKGIGLILVDQKSRCFDILNVPPNPDVEESKRDAVKKQLGLQADDRIPDIGCLSTSDATVANKLLCLVDETITEAVRTALRKVFKQAKKKGKNWDVYPIAGSEGCDARVFRVYFDHGAVDVEIDPFGAYLRDGRPCIWVSKAVEDDFFETKGRRCDSIGTHAYFLDKGDVVSLYDATTDRARRCSEAGFWSFLMHQIPFLGRSRSGLEDELEAVIRAAKQLKG